MANFRPGPTFMANWKKMVASGKFDPMNPNGFTPPPTFSGKLPKTGIGITPDTYGKKKFPWDKVKDQASDIVPYVSNIANSLRRPPRPKAPNLVGGVTLSNPSLASERTDINRQVQGLTKSFDTSLDANAAAASKIGANIQGLRAVGQSYEKEANMKTNVGNSQAQINANIDALNAGKMDQYGRDKVEMQIAHQREQSENISNAADKYVQGEYRSDMMDLDKTKFGILSQAYSNSGVTNRLVNRILGKSQDYVPTDDETQKVVSGSSNMYGGKLKKVYAAGGFLEEDPGKGKKPTPFALAKANAFAKDFTARKGLLIAEDAHVGNRIPKFVNQAGQEMAPSKGPQFPAGTFTNINQIPTYVTGNDIQYDLGTPYYKDATSSDIQFIHPDLARAPRFNPNRGQTADQVVMRRMGGPLKKVNKNRQAIVPEMANSYTSYAMGGKLGAGLQLPRMRGRIRKIK